ncbi:MAG: endonuclease domain-containing protein [Solirubrobacterales bacterium]
MNAQIGPYKVDFRWREMRLVVETDGWIYHRGRQAREDDLARDAELRLRGYTVARFTDRQLEADPAGVAATVRSLLGG